ncbi:hypothetical protein [Novosphingobium sp.]|uniref:hypothetical protein n=1 Tax=Novosphingobium sp. TaxID=1874826 RepID=UPI00333E63AB
MLHTPKTAGFTARFMTFVRETFEASVAIHYHAPWANLAKAKPDGDRAQSAQLPV